MRHAARTAKRCGGAIEHGRGASGSTGAAGHTNTVRRSNSHRDDMLHNNIRGRNRLTNSSAARIIALQEDYVSRGAHGDQAASRPAPDQVPTSQLWEPKRQDLETEAGSGVGGVATVPVQPAPPGGTHAWD